MSLFSISKDDLESCMQSCNDRKKTLEDKKTGSKSKIIFENKLKNEFFIINIDGCIKKLESIKKCDYAVLYLNNIYYIELKGTDIDKGILQLKNTIDIFSNLYLEKNKKAILVVNHVNPYYNTKMQMYQIKMKKDNIELKIKATPAEINLS